MWVCLDLKFKSKIFAFKYWFLMEAPTDGQERQISIPVGETIPGEDRWILI